MSNSLVYPSLTKPSSAESIIVSRPPGPLPVKSSESSPLNRTMSGKAARSQAIIARLKMKQMAESDNTDEDGSDSCNDSESEEEEEEEEEGEDLGPPNKHGYYNEDGFLDDLCSESNDSDYSTLSDITEDKYEHERPTVSRKKKKKPFRASSPMAHESNHQTKNRGKKKNTFPTRRRSLENVNAGI